MKILIYFSGYLDLLTTNNSDLETKTFFPNYHLATPLEILSKTEIMRECQTKQIVQ